MQNTDNLLNVQTFHWDILGLGMHWITFNLDDRLVSELNNYSRLADGCRTFALAINSSIIFHCVDVNLFTE